MLNSGPSQAYFAITILMVYIVQRNLFISSGPSDIPGPGPGMAAADHTPTWRHDSTDYGVAELLDNPIIITAEKAR